MTRLEQLMRRSKCSVQVEVNHHKGDYSTVARFLAEREENEFIAPGDIAPEVREVMESTDTMIEVTVYPDTPIGSYTVYHYDLDAAIILILEALGEPVFDRAHETHELAIAINGLKECEADAECCPSCGAADSARSTLESILK